MRASDSCSFNYICLSLYIENHGATNNPNQLSKPASTRSKDGLVRKNKASLHIQSQIPPPSKSDHSDDERVKAKPGNSTISQDSSSSRTVGHADNREPGIIL